jgi:hypothetical protein
MTGRTSWSRNAPNAHRQRDAICHRCNIAETRSDHSHPSFLILWRDANRVKWLSYYLTPVNSGNPVAIYTLRTALMYMTYLLRRRYIGL